MSRTVLASRRRSRPLHVRRRRAVRSAVPADAVLRAGDAEPGAEHVGSVRRAAGAVSATKATSSAARSDRPLLVVPALSVRVSPEVAVVPMRAPPAPAAAPPQPTAGRGRGAAPAARCAGHVRRAAGRGARQPPAPPPPPAPEASETREIRVTVVNDTKGRSRERRGARGAGRLDATPAEQTVKFDARRRIADGSVPAAGAEATRLPASTRSVRRLSRRPATFTRGYQVIEYPHITRQHIYHAAATTSQGDRRQDGAEPDRRLHHGRRRRSAGRARAARREVEIPAGGRSRLGRSVALPDIVTGVRAYERRADLRANNAGCSTTCGTAAR